MIIFCWVMCKYSSNMIAFACNNYCNKSWVIILQLPIKKRLLLLLSSPRNLRLNVNQRKAPNPATNFQLFFLIWDSVGAGMSSGKDTYIIWWKYSNYLMQSKWSTKHWTSTLLPTTHHQQERNELLAISASVKRERNKWLLVEVNKEYEPSSVGWAVQRCT